MFSNEYIFRQVEETRKKYWTRDPYELLGSIGAEVHFTREFSPEGLKGYCTVIKRIKIAVINGFLNEWERRMVAGHEAGHLILHMNEIYRSPVRALRDFHVLSETGRIEREANMFLADFMLTDDDVMESVSNEYNDIYSSARELGVLPELLAFKLYSMNQRDYRVRCPIDLNSKFLG